jgi:hypothetical protein
MKNIHYSIWEGRDYSTGTPEAAIRARMLDIARGKFKPAKDEPKIWFTSMKYGRPHLLGRANA